MVVTDATQERRGNRVGNVSGTLYARATVRMALCAHCEVSITDPTTQVVHGDLTFCCTNCAEAMEHVAGGSDPRPLSRRGDPPLQPL